MVASTYQGPKPDDQSRARARPRVGHRRGEHEGCARRADDGGAPGLRSASLPSRSSATRPRCADTLAGPGSDTLGGRPGWPHAVTMTAELSQAFRTKREGVAFVLDALADGVPRRPAPRVHGGRPVRAAERRAAAPARGRRVELGGDGHAGGPDRPGRASWWISAAPPPTSFPLAGGRVAARGRTDPARLPTGELVYTGAVRTPAEALVREVPLWDGRAAVSAEWFATIGDAHVWLGTPRIRRTTRRRPPTAGR